MKKTNTLDITSDVKWIGIIDHDLVTFDVVMETKYGTTYNSYLIDADKKAVIETSKEKFSSEYIAKIRQVTDPSEIKYIILNHTEPDHSGNLAALLELAPEATVVGSGNALRYLEDMVDIPFRSLKVKDGDKLDLGNKTLHFIGAPNLHWPDSMYTWLEEDRILFTCDSFGCHFAHEAMFDDLVGDFDDAFQYYFDVILKPFSKFMIKAIDKIRALDIAVIAPGHGPILRQNWKKYVDLSEAISKEYLQLIESSEKKVFIPYVSAYGYTGQMAEAIKEGIEQSGDVTAETMDIEHVPIGELESKITLSNGIIIGSPTINQNILLPVYKLFAVINPLRDKGKLAGAFGSYGWSGEGVKLIEDHLRNLKLNLFQQGIAAKFKPDEESFDRLKMYGEAFARRLTADQ
jgi:NADH oxidase (H2O-forming)